MKRLIVLLSLGFFQTTLGGVFPLSEQCLPFKLEEGMPIYKIEGIGYAIGCQKLGIHNGVAYTVLSNKFGGGRSHGSPVDTSNFSSIDGRMAPSTFHIITIRSLPRKVPFAIDSEGYLYIFWCVVERDKCDAFRESSYRRRD